MAFAQITHREGLRDIEACLSAQSSKLYHLGLRAPVHRSTLSDANEARDFCCNITCRFQNKKMHNIDEVWRALKELEPSTHSLEGCCSIQLS